MPSAVAVPSDIDDLVLLVAHANEAGWQLIPRGAGSGMPGGNVGPGVIVDLQRFGQPLVVREPDRATVGAGVTWKELDETAAEQNLRFAPNPSSGAYCTFGGMVAANAAGARSVLAGPVRSWVQGLEIVTGDGEVVSLARGERADAAPTRLESRFAAVALPQILRATSTIRQRYPRTRKNSAGYALDAYLDSGDLVDLVVGSEGTLAFVTQATVRLEPRPPIVAGVLMGLRTLDSIGEVVPALLPLRPAALELLDRSFLDVAHASVPFSLTDLAAVLLVDFEGDDIQSIENILQEAIRVTSGQASLVLSALSAKEHTEMWALRHAASPVLAALPESKRSLQIIEDGCVPVMNLGTYLSEVRRAADALQIEIVAFGHAGDGHLHVNTLVDTTATDFEKRVSALLERVTQIVLDLGGTPSGEHGDGRIRASALRHLYGSDILDLFRLVKQVFDPNGVLNPDVVLTSTEAQPIVTLKVGSTTETIPHHLATGLRRLERTGGWGTPKLELLAGENSR